MLFSEFVNFNYRFPEPQYLGSKFSHLAWIKKYIPSDTKIALDAFAGSQSVSFLFKQMGIQTITNDFLNFNNQIGLALIENKSEVITNEDLELLFNSGTNNNRYNLINSLYTNIFFEEEEAKFLDNVRFNINFLPTIYKRALAFSVINRSMTRKITMGHFAHTQALNYSKNPERIKRNRSLARPLKDLFLEILPNYNNAVFDNGKDNMSYNKNILELLPLLKGIDLAYFDPPYCNSHADYQSFYHLLETFTEYWDDKRFVNEIKRYEPQRFSGFDKKKEVIQSFEYLFLYSQDIPYWLVSYNDRSYPNVKELTRIISKYKDVSVECKKYNNSRGGKGSVAGSQEIIFICKPKQKFYV